MPIEPFIKCSDIPTSIKFYTELLDFEMVQAPDPDPSSFMSMYSFLTRDGAGIHLSSHSGDGIFGNVIYIHVNNIDTLYQQFVDNGLNIENQMKIQL